MNEHKSKILTVLSGYGREPIPPGSEERETDDDEIRITDDGETRITD